MPIGSLRKTVAAALIVCVASAAAVQLLPYRIASGVTAERLRSLRPGMHEFELLQTLGPPLAFRQWGPGRKILDYARETPFVNHSPNLWILVRDGRVEEVQADRSVQFFDEEGLFLLRKDVRWEAPGFTETFR